MDHIKPYLIHLQNYCLNKNKKAAAFSFISACEEKKNIHYEKRKMWPTGRGDSSAVNGKLLRLRGHRSNFKSSAAALSFFFVASQTIQNFVCGGE